MPIWKHSTTTEAWRWVAFIAGLIGNIAYMLFCIFALPACIAVLYIMTTGQ